MVKTNMIRKIWGIVETDNPYKIINSSDRELTQSIISQVEEVSPLSSEDVNILNRYVTARTLLIRDLAYSKIS